MKLKIELLNALSPAPMSISKLNRGLLGVHAEFFDGVRAFGGDKRSKPEIAVGRVDEPGLLERWQVFEQEYLDTPRLNKFWHVQLEDALVFPPFGITVVDGTIVRDTVRTAETLSATFPLANPDDLRRLFRKEIDSVDVGSIEGERTIDEPAYLLGYGMSDNYFNWTLRYMSRIRLFQNDSHSEVVLVPGGGQRFIAHGLEAFGVPASQVRFIDRPLHCKTLSISAPSALGRYELSLFITHTLRDHPRVEELWPRNSELLYIPRHNVKMRTVVNESDIEARLAKKGFLIHDSALSPVVEQMAIYKSAKVIVSPHGAGLSNIVYCRPGTKVLEITPQGYDQGVTSYRSLSDLFGLEYHQIFASEVTVDPKGNRCNSDISVDWGEVDSKLKSFGVG